MLDHFFGPLALQLWPARVAENRQDFCAITAVYSGAPSGIALNYGPAFLSYESHINDASIGHTYREIGKKRGAELFGFR